MEASEARFFVLQRNLNLPPAGEVRVVVQGGEAQRFHGLFRHRCSITPQVYAIDELRIGEVSNALTINPQRIVSGREPGFYTQRLLIQRVRNVGLLSARAIAPVVSASVMG